MIRKALGKVSGRFQKWRVKWYRFVLSEQRDDETWRFLKALQPVVINGKGRVKIGAEGLLKVIIGWESAPNFYCGNSYIEARYKSARIDIGEGTIFNNNCTISANTTTISFGRNCRIGVNCSFFDSDFHGIHPDERDKSSDTLPDRPVTIGDNVFIGSNVTILKGCSIGYGSIIGSGSVVSKSVPPMTIAAGNPCRAIRLITERDRHLGDR